MPPSKLNRYPPLSILSSKAKINGKTPNSRLDFNVNGTLLGIETPASSPGKRRGRPPKLYYMCRNCTDVFRSKIGQVLHVKSCSKKVFARKTLPVGNNYCKIEDVVKSEEKLEIANEIEETMEMDIEEQDTPNRSVLQNYPSLSEDQSLAAIDVHEDIMLKDQVDVGTILSSNAVVHSPDYLFKRKSSESSQSEDKSEHLAEASTSDASSVVLHQNVAQIEEAQSSPENFPCICKPCSSRSFKTELELMRHVRKHHSYPKIKVALSKLEKFYDAEDRSVCPICSKPLSSTFRSDFVNHLLIHSTEKLQVCEICDQKFTKKDYLRRHIKRHVITKDSLTSSLAKSGDSETIDDPEDGTDNAIQPGELYSSRSEAAKVSGTVVQRVCYGPATDGTDQWVVKWQKLDYEDLTKNWKTNVSTQTIDQSNECFGDTFSATANFDLDSTNIDFTDSDDAFVTPVLDSPARKTNKIVLDSSSVVDQQDERTMVVVQKFNKASTESDEVLVANLSVSKPTKSFSGSSNVEQQEDERTMEVVQKLNRSSKKRKHINKQLHLQTSKATKATKAIKINGECELIQIQEPNSVADAITPPLLGLSTKMVSYLSNAVDQQDKQIMEDVQKLNEGLEKQKVREHFNKQLKQIDQPTSKVTKANKIKSQYESMQKPTSLLDALVTTPLLEPPALKPMKIVLESSNVVERKLKKSLKNRKERKHCNKLLKQVNQNDQLTPKVTKAIAIESKFASIQSTAPAGAVFVTTRKYGKTRKEHRQLKHIFKNDPLSPELFDTIAITSKYDLIQRPIELPRKSDLKAKSWLNPSTKKDKFASDTQQLRMNQGAKHFRKRLILDEFVDECEETTKPKFNQNKNSPAQENVKVEEENNSSQGMPYRNVAVDQFDQAFEQSAEGLIQQLKQVAFKGSNKKSSSALKSSGCPKVVGKSTTETVTEVRLLPELAEKMTPSGQNTRTWRRRGENLNASP